MPWGVTVWPVGQKVALFGSVKVVMGMVQPKHAQDSYPMPQNPSYAYQSGLGTLPQPAISFYEVPWGISVRPVGQKVALFESVKVVMGMV